MEEQLAQPRNYLSLKEEQLNPMKREQLKLHDRSWNVNTSSFRIDFILIR